MAPSTDELIYAWHPDGFALHSMRSSTVSRLYLQVPNGTGPAAWSDERICDELGRRLGDGQDGCKLTPGPITDKSALPMRSHVQTPMRHERLFLAGDTALRRVWRCTHFSWWMTTMLHASGDPFDARLQLSQLRRIASSEAGATGLAENYAGLPLVHG